MDIFNFEVTSKYLDDYGHVNHAAYLEIFEEVHALMGDKFKFLITSYRKDSKKLLELVKQGIEKNDSTLLFESAHTLKSSSRHIGALNLSKVSEDMEKYGKAQNLDAAKNTLNTLENEFLKLMKSLDHLLKDL